MKKVAILYSSYSPTVDAIKYQLRDFDVSAYNKLPENAQEFDLIISTDYEGNFKGLKCHHSLLPAFNGKNPLKQAILAGVKVTGITIYYTEPLKIITQYPLIIDGLSHFDEIETRLKYLEQVIYPLVAEKFIKNEPIEIQNLLNKNACSGNCNSCGKCSDTKG